MNGGTPLIFYTICLRLNLPEVQAWLQPEIADLCAALSPPELPSAQTPGSSG